MVKKKSSPVKRSTQLQIAKLTKPKRGQIDSRVLREIKYFQRSTHLLIPKAPFLRLLRELLYSYADGDNPFRITEMAVDAIKEAAEAFLVGLFEDAYLLSMHAKRVTLFPRDITLALSLRNDFGMRYAS